MNIILVIGYFVFVIAILILLIFFFLYLLTTLISASSPVPYLGTKWDVIRRVFEEIKFKKGQRFYDLGSGDGRVAVYVQKKYGVKATGIELNPILVVFSKIYARLKDSGAQFEAKNILSVDLSDADIIYIFLFPGIIKKLAPKLSHECRKGTLIISHGFAIKPLSNKLIKTLEDQPFSTYYYRI